MTSLSLAYSPARGREGSHPRVVRVLADIDRSHRKLAARGSRLGLVHASAATVRRVLAAEGLLLASVTVMDVVSRRWLAILVCAEETSTEIEAAFTKALHTAGPADRIDAALLARLRTGVPCQ